MLPKVFISGNLWDDTGRLLASFARRKDDVREGEGVVYWFGLELGDRAVVTTLVVPDADTSFGSIRTTAAANVEAMSVMVDTPLVLLGQAHSHPGRWVEHSPIDDRDTFAQFPGCFSVVFPYYAKRDNSIGRCGIHRHLAGRFRRLRSAQLDEHLQLLPKHADFRRGNAK